MTIAAQWGWARKGDMCTGEWKLWQAPRPGMGLLHQATPPSCEAKRGNLSEKGEGIQK